jgi:hypothetical protein
MCLFLHVFLFLCVNGVVVVLGGLCNFLMKIHQRIERLMCEVEFFGRCVPLKRYKGFFKWWP